MKELTGDNEDPKGVTLNSMAHPTNTGGQPLRTSSTLNNTNLVNGGLTLGTNSIGQATWGHSATQASPYQQAQAQQTAQLRAMLDEAKLTQDRRSKKAHETLFGRLKNYLHPEI
jgi:predicted amidohydrolase